MDAFKSREALQRGLDGPESWPVISSGVSTWDRVILVLVFRGWPGAGQEEMEWSCIRRSSAWSLGKVLHWGGAWSLEQWSGHSIKLPRSIWSTLLVMWFSFKRSCKKRGVGLDDPSGPFQLKIFCDSFFYLPCLLCGRHRGCRLKCSNHPPSLFTVSVHRIHFLSVTLNTWAFSVLAFNKWLSKVNYDIDVAFCIWKVNREPGYR